MSAAGSACAGTLSPNLTLRFDIATPECEHGGVSACVHCAGGVGVGHADVAAAALKSDEDLRLEILDSLSHDIHGRGPRCRQQRHPTGESALDLSQMHSELEVILTVTRSRMASIRGEMSKILQDIFSLSSPFISSEKQVYVVRAFLAEYLEGLKEYQDGWLSSPLKTTQEAGALQQSCQKRESERKHYYLRVEECIERWTRDLSRKTCRNRLRLLLQVDAQMDLFEFYIDESFSRLRYLFSDDLSVSAADDRLTLCDVGSKDAETVTIDLMCKTEMDVRSRMRHLVYQWKNTLASLIPAVDDYLCPICLCICYPPVSLGCQHRLCEPCIQRCRRWRLSRSRSDQAQFGPPPTHDSLSMCPVCRAQRSERPQLHIDHQYREFLENLFPRECREKRGEGRGKLYTITSASWARIKKWIRPFRRNRVDGQRDPHTTVYLHWLKLGRSFAHSSDFDISLDMGASMASV